MEPHGLSPCLHAEVRYGTQAWYLHKNTLLRQGFGGLSATGEIRRSNKLQHLQSEATGYAFVHGQSPCLHAEVPAFTEAHRVARRYGTQAWSSA
jgi:hypothetical protein